jgi:O-antigen/teichoic acid export membrane protein
VSVTNRMQRLWREDASAVPASYSQDRPSDLNRLLTLGYVALVANTGLAALLGIAYWLVAAHLFEPATVGEGSALIGALVAVSGLAQVNFPRSLSWLIPSAGEKSITLLGKVYAFTAVVSLILGGAFVLVAPHLTQRFAYLRWAPALLLIFAVSTALYSVFNLEDAVLASARQVWVIPLENSAFGILKLPALWAVTFTGLRTNGLGIFYAWVAPLALIVLPVNLYIFGKALPRSAAATIASVARPKALIRSDFACYLASITATMALPTIVLSVLGPVQAAAFYVPFIIAIQIDMMSMNLGNMLTAEISRVGGRLTEPMARYIVRILAVVAVLAFVLIISAQLVLGLFGHNYRVLGTGVFRLLMLSAVPRCAVLLSVATARGQSRSGLAALLQTTGMLGTLVLAVVLMPWLGLLGIGIAWLAGSSVSSGLAVATVLRDFVRIRGISDAVNATTG